MSNTLIKNKRSRRKSTNFIFILFLFLVLVLSFLIYLFFTASNNDIRPKDLSLAGKWNYFAATDGLNYIGAGSSDGEYFKLNKNGKAAFKISREIKDATWNSDGNYVDIFYGDKVMRLAQKDKVLIYENGDKKMYFARENTESNFKSQILSKASYESNNQLNIVEINSENLDNILGNWYRFATESATNGVEQIEKDKSYVLNISKNKKIILDEGKGKWKLDDKSGFLDTTIDKEKGMIFQMNDKLVFVSKGQIDYYSRNKNITEYELNFINEIKMTKEGDINE